MVSLKQLTAFQREIALGLGTLSLLILGFGGAANWALWNYSTSARATSELELTGLALECASGLERGEQSLDQLQGIVTGAGGGRAMLYLFDSQSARASTLGAPTPIVNLVADLDFTSEVGINSIDVSEYRYTREKFGDWELYHCPVYIEGEWKTLALVRECSLLAGMENAYNMLFWFGLAILTLIIVSTIRLFRLAAAPYERIQSQVKSVGVESSDAVEAVEEVVSEYKRTISELQEKELRLVELNEKLESHISDVERVNRYFLSSMSTGVLILDRKGEVVGLNAQAEEWLDLNISAQDVAGAENVEDYVGLFSAEPELKSRFDDALLSSKALEFDYDLAIGDGQVRTLGVSLIPLNEEDGQLRELVALISDQTERAKSERRLEDSRRLATLGEMSAGLAHQLRNSISAAMGFGALAHKRIDDKVVAQSDIQALMLELKEEAALVERFLTYAKPLSLSLESCEVGEWIRGLLVGLQGNGRLESVISLNSPEKVNAQIDKLLLKQVIVNLVDNAGRIVAQETGEIAIAARSEGEMFRISISDNGPGIAPEEREKIFTPFYSSSPSGVGLGLPLAKRIVALHGGRLFVEDSTLGGAKFVMEMPLIPNLSETGVSSQLSEVHRRVQSPRSH